MRKNKFRGKLVADSEAFKGYKKDSFVYGGIYNEVDKWYIVRHFNIFEVDPETVGQFTGLTDKNGKDIYEGDIIKYQSFANWDSITGYYDSRNIGTVYYNENKTSFFVKMEIKVYVSSFHYIGENAPLSKTSTTWGLEVIGNIHDNPSLLK